MAEVTLGLTGAFSHGRGFSELSAVATPAVAVGFTIPVESRYWERLSALSFKLVADANAANRQVTLTVRDGLGIPVATYPAASTQAATLTYVYSFLPDVSTFSTVVGTSVISPGPKFFLQSAWSLVVTIGAVQVADQVSEIRYYRERFSTGSGGYEQGKVVDVSDRDLLLLRLAEVLS